MKLKTYQIALISTIGAIALFYIAIFFIFKTILIPSTLESNEQIISIVNDNNKDDGKSKGCNIYNTINSDKNTKLFLNQQKKYSFISNQDYQNNSSDNKDRKLIIVFPGNGFYADGKISLINDILITNKQQKTVPSNDLNVVVFNYN